MASVLGQVGVGVRGPGRAGQSLSGGNQQKVLFARILLRESAGPGRRRADRGVDVGAKRAIYELLTSLAAEGLACC